MAYKRIQIPKGVKHSLWGVIDAALYPVVSIATIPIMIHGLGLVTFGLWILLNSMITILQLFNFNTGVANMGMATVRNVSTAPGDNDARHMNDIVNGTLHIILLFFIGIVGIGYILSLVAVQNAWWGLGNAKGTNVALCILLATVIAGLKYFDQVFQSIIKAYEHFKMSSILNMIYRFGSLGLTLVMAVAHYSLDKILWANIVFLIAYLILQFCCVKWIMPAWRIGKLNESGLYRSILHISIWPWIQVVIVVLTFQTDRFWVSSNFGLKVVSGYGLVSTIFNHIHMIFTAMAFWILPRIALMVKKGEDPAKLYYLVRGTVLGIIVIALLLFNYTAPLLLPFWAGKDTSAMLLMYIKYFVGFEIVFAHSIMPSFYLNAAGKGRLATKLILFYCSVCYVFMLCGLWLYHTPMAMIGGMTIAMCVTMPAVNAVVQKEMYQTYSWRQALFEMLPMYGAILLLYNDNNIWTYIVLALIVSMLLWKFYLSNLFNNRRWQQTPYM